MKDEEGTGIIVLFHEIFSFVDSAEFEGLEKAFLNIFILHERRKGEMTTEALQDEGFIDKTFLLIDDGEVFIDFLICVPFDGSISMFLPFSLNKVTITSS